MLHSVQKMLCWQRADQILRMLTTPYIKYYVLLVFHLGIILFNDDQLDTQLFFFVYVYFNSLHVSGIQVLIIRRFNFINTISCIRHSDRLVCRFGRNSFQNCTPDDHLHRVIPRDPKMLYKLWLPWICFLRAWRWLKRESKHVALNCILCYKLLCLDWYFIVCMY